MSRRRPPELARAYRACGTEADVHTAVRWATSPMPVLERELPLSGDVLEVGCGHGLFTLYAALRSPGRRVVGVDLDREKLDVARQAAAELGLGPDRVRFDEVPAGWLPDPSSPCAAVVVIDVLYLLGVGPAVELCGAAADAVAPGGRLLVKEMDTSRRWRAGLGRLQELVSTRVTRVTEGATVELVPLPLLRARMEERGLDVEQVDLSARSHVPHALLLGRRR